MSFFWTTEPTLTSFSWPELRQQAGSRLCFCPKCSQAKLKLWLWLGNCSAFQALLIACTSGNKKCFNEFISMQIQPVSVSQVSFSMKQIFLVEFCVQCIYMKQKDTIHFHVHFCDCKYNEIFSCIKKQVCSRISRQVFCQESSFLSAHAQNILH